MQNFLTLLLLAAIVAVLVRLITATRSQRHARRQSASGQPADINTVPPDIAARSDVAGDAGAANSASGAAAAAEAHPDAPADARAVEQSIYLRLHQLAFGERSRVPAPLSTDEPIAAAVRAALADIAAQPNYAPRRPLLLPKLVQAVNDTDVSRRELAAIIARDPALAGNLLRLANSSFYRVNNQPVESVDRAVALLGTEGIRSLIVAALMQPVFRISAGEFAHFPDITWEHTYRAASATEAHAAIVENSDPFAGQLLGLLLGLARIVIFRVAMDQYTTHQLSPDAAGMATLIDTHAAPVARQIAASWELSDRIDKALTDQDSQVATAHLTALGRSLRFGRFIGALAVLSLQGLINDDEVKSALTACGYSHPSTERIWGRLTSQAEG